MVQPQSSAAEASKRVGVFMAALMSAESFDALTLPDLQLVSCKPGQVVFSLKVAPKLQNRYGTLHGGAIGTLVDVVGSLALITQSDRSGVSLAINTLYLNPMPGGEEVQIEANVIKLGRDVATIEVQLRRCSNGQLVATGTHTKKLTSASDMSALFEAALTVQQPTQQQQQTTQHPQRQQQQQQQQQQQTQTFHKGQSQPRQWQAQQPQPAAPLRSKL